MIWFIKNSILSIALVTALLCISYELLKRLTGIKTTQRLFSSNLARFLMVAVTIAIFCRVFGTYGFIAAWLFLTVLSVIWLGSWPFRRLKAGKMISTVRRPKLPRSVIWTNLYVNLFFWGFFGSALWSAAWLASKTIPKGYLINPNALAIHLLAVTFFLLSSYVSIFGRPAYRANGICYQCKFIPWHQITSYSFKALSQGMLILDWQPTIAIYVREQHIPITSEQVNLVKTTLGEHLEVKP